MRCFRCGARWRETRGALGLWSLLSREERWLVGGFRFVGPWAG